MQLDDAFALNKAIKALKLATLKFPCEKPKTTKYHGNVRQQSSQAYTSDHNPVCNCNFFTILHDSCIQ